VSRRGAVADAAALGALALAVNAMFWPAVLLRGTFFVQDMMVQNYPFRHLCGLALRSGSLPVWRPEINCGFPLLAEGQAGVFYPFNFLTYLCLPTHAGLNLNILCHCWLAGAGTYVLLRLLGAGRLPALTGGLTFALSGFLIVRAMSPNYVDVCAWLPVGLCCVELALNRQRASWLLAATGVGALQHLAGHPQAAVYSMLAVQAYAVWRSASLRAGWRWAVAGLVAMPAGAALLAAVQLLPTMELVRLSGRAQGLDWERFVSMSLPPERLVTLLLPDAFGNPADGTYWGRDAGFYIQLCGYVGVLPLFLALNGLLRSRAAAAEFFGALAAAGLLLALGQYTALFDVLYQIPGMAFFRIPARFLLWFAFGASVLCGLGLQELLARRAPVRRRARWWLAAAALGLIGAMLAQNWALVCRPAAAAAAALTKFDARAYRWQLCSEAWRAAALVAVGCRVLAGTRSRWSRALIRWSLPALVATDLLWFGRGFNGLLDASVYRQVPRSARLIHNDAGPERIIPPRVLSLVAEANSGLDWHSGWRRDQAAYRAYPGTLRMYTAGLFGLHNALPGWSPLHLAAHWEFMQGYPRFAALAGVEYALRPQGCPEGPYQRVGDTWPAVCRHMAALPRAYVVDTCLVIPEARQRLRYMMSEAFDPRRQVILEQEPPNAPTGAGGAAVRVTAYTPHAVDLELGDCRGGYLVLSDTHYPGWRAWVDGRPVPLLRANHVFRAVSLQPGARRVRMAMRSRSLEAGAALSVLAWIAWGAGLVRLRGRAARLAVRRRGRRVGLNAWVARIALVLLVHGMLTRWDLWAGCLSRCKVPGAWG